MDQHPERLFANPLDGVGLGDPFVLKHRGRFYLYGTNDGPPLADGRVIPVYRSDDLIRWEPLGGALEPIEPHSDHWAPEVFAWNGRFFMVVSFGDVEHRGHALWVAVADSPQGPFRLQRRVSDPSEKFSIDGSWLLDDDGKLYLFRCLDFVDGDAPPHGTGIVAQAMADPFTPAGEPSVVLRAHAPWHLFEANRTMPLYGGNRYPEWTTIEGPAPVVRWGRYFCGYSGGNYTGNYGTGEAVADAPLGPYEDLRGREGPLFATTPGLVEGPGHFSVVQPDLLHDWIVLHGRRPGEGVRRVWLCPAKWDAQGIAIGPLTDQPQPAPPLPGVLRRMADDGPSGWTLRAGRWHHEPGDGLRLEPSDGPASCSCDAPSPGPIWALEVYLRFPQTGPGSAGLTVTGEGSNELSIAIPADPSGSIATTSRGPAPLPMLGDDPFNPRAFHRLEVRAEAGHAEIRLDGLVIAREVELPEGPLAFQLRSETPAIFDAFVLADAADS